MKPVTLAFTFALGLALALAPACKKDDAPASSGGSPGPAATTAPAKPAEPAPAPTPVAAPDHVRVRATHTNPKPTDPVVIEIRTFRITSARLDPAKVEGGRAEIALDLASIESRSDKRDRHLRSSDYLDVDSFATATIVVDEVVAAGGDRYRAKATVTARGVERAMPVEFQVVGRTDRAVTIEARHRFSRHDFGIGKPAGGDDSAASELEIDLRLTIENT